MACKFVSKQFNELPEQLGRFLEPLFNELRNSPANAKGKTGGIIMEVIADTNIINGAFIPIDDFELLCGLIALIRDKYGMREDAE